MSRMGVLGFFSRKEPHCGREVKKRRTLSDRAKTWMRLHGTHCMRLELARETDDRQALSELAKAKRNPADDLEIAAEVAQNPNTPVETLLPLSKDWRFEVRKGVIRNPNAPDNVLAALACDHDRRVRLAVASRNDCPLERIAEIIGTYPIKKTHPVDRQGRIDLEQPAKYEHSDAFERLANLVNRNERQKRKAIITAVKLRNPGLAAELANAVRWSSYPSELCFRNMIKSPPW